MGNVLDVNVVDGLLSPFANKSMGIVPGGLRDLWTTPAVATVRITNSGNMAGCAVSQLYVSLLEDTTLAGAPGKVLRGSEKVYLEPGESEQLDFELTRSDLSYPDVEEQQWVISMGSLTFKAGFSSRDLRSRKKSVMLG
jgi:beta-glucosidase